MGGHPVQLGLVASLSRPGGNLTGVSYLNNQLGAKRLELLREMLGGVDLIAVLVNTASPTQEAEMRDVEAAARAIGQKIRILNVVSSSEIEAAFATLAAQRAGAVLIISSNLFTLERAPEDIETRIERGTELDPVIRMICACSGAENINQEQCGG
jgi:putative ABC transport system substrate-binding protein